MEEYSVIKKEMNSLRSQRDLSEMPEVIELIGPRKLRQLTDGFSHVMNILAHYNINSSSTLKNKRWFSMGKGIRMGVLWPYDGSGTLVVGR